MKTVEWLKWTLGHAASASLGLSVVLVPAVGAFLLNQPAKAGSPVPDRVEPVAAVLAGLMWLALPWLGGAIGLSLGLYQASFLKKRLPTLSRPLWLVISALCGLLPGWLLLFAVVMAGSNGGIQPADMAAYVGGVVLSSALFAGIAGLLAGGVTGAYQGFVLRKNWPGLPARWLWLWLAATLAGWTLSWSGQGAAAGLVVTSTAYGAVNYLQLAAGLVGLLVAWGFCGALTGLLLVHPGVSKLLVRDDGFSRSGPANR